MGPFVCVACLLRKGVTTSLQSPHFLDREKTIGSCTGSVYPTKLRRPHDDDPEALESDYWLYMCQRCCVRPCRDHVCCFIALETPMKNQIFALRKEAFGH